MKPAKTILVVAVALLLVVPAASADEGSSFDLSRLWAYLVDQLDSRGGWDPNGLSTDEGGYLDPNGARTDEGGWIDPYGATVEGGVFMDPLGATTDEGGFVDPYGRGIENAPRREGNGLDPYGLPGGTQNATGTGDKGMGLDPNG